MQEIISVLKFLAESNTINFIIMLVILGWIVKKVNLGKSFDKSVSEVEVGIKRSDEEKAHSEVLFNEADALMKKLPEDVKTLEKNAAEKAEVFKQQIEENTQAAIFNLGKNVDRTLAIEEKKISNILTDKTSVASVELAKKHIINMLKYNQELHNHFIQNSLDELDKVKL